MAEEDQELWFARGGGCGYADDACAEHDDVDWLLRHLDLQLSRQSLT